MNEYMATFQAITHSVKQVGSDQSSSVEIKDSAKRLSESLHPCFKELRESAARLQRLTQVCINDLADADDVRLSKYRIIQAPKPAIWDQVSELTGASFRVRQLGEECQTELVTKVHDVWSKKATQLRNKWFFDNQKKEFKKAINVFEKDTLLKELRSELEALRETLIETTQSGLKLMNQELELIESNTLNNCLNRLDKWTQITWQEQITSSRRKLGEQFGQAMNSLPSKIRDFPTLYNDALNNFGKQNRLGMNVEAFEKFCEDLFPILADLIKVLFTDRTQVAIEAIDQRIAFYNELLTKQERYQQETPEQWQAEKAWINEQRQKIQQVLQGVEMILAEGIANDRNRV
ncbi:hypothetical protein NG791_02330 [Laspinema sp. D1]|uniref:hypothetical protein n=1 Tax=Laspinema palackyanum TaxID=3231601 RepID=UPI003497E85A|nr:hypothetical protein [Laspinema sp. D2b]